jgi:hypothetical protein
LLVTLACTTSPTQLVVHVGTDLEVGPEIDGFDARVWGPGEGLALHLTATTVSPGRVLLVGGNAALETDIGHINTAPRVAAGLVTVTDGGATLDPIDLAVARYGHTATLLADGSVVLVGGLAQRCVNESAGVCDSFDDPAS